MSDIHVKIIKKSEKENYPEHISVRKNSSHEMVQLYFDKGILKKFVHTASSQTTEVTVRTFNVNNGVFLPQDGSPSNPFYVKIISSIEKKRALFFFDKNLNVAFSIKTDLKGKCPPDYYNNYSAEIEEIFLHTREPLSLQNLKECERD